MSVKFLVSLSVNLSFPQILHTRFFVCLLNGYKKLQFYSCPILYSLSLPLCIFIPSMLQCAFLLFSTLSATPTVIVCRIRVFINYSFFFNFNKHLLNHCFVILAISASVLIASHFLRPSLCIAACW